MFTLVPTTHSTGLAVLVVAHTPPLDHAHRREPNVRRNVRKRRRTQPRMRTTMKRE